MLFPARAATAALGVMGLLAAMLAVTGVFGMAAYSVSKRLKELGIRLALGSQRRQLVRAALGRPLVLLFSGSMLGLLLGVGASRLLARLVYQATPRDPLVLIGGGLDHDAGGLDCHLDSRTPGLVRRPRTVAARRMILSFAGRPLILWI